MARLIFLIFFFFNFFSLPLLKKFTPAALVADSVELWWILGMWLDGYYRDNLRVEEEGEEEET